MIRNRLLSAVLVIVPLMTLSKNIALVMYDGDLEDINRSLIEKEIFASINAATTNYYPLKKSNVSYEQILNKNLIEMLRENDFVITFLSGKESQILHEVLEFYNVKHFSLSPENCHWVSPLLPEYPIIRFGKSLMQKLGLFFKLFMYESIRHTNLDLSIT